MRMIIIALLPFATDSAGVAAGLRLKPRRRESKRLVGRAVRPDLSELRFDSWAIVATLVERWLASWEE
jgi:hypothetical protein